MPKYIDKGIIYKRIYRRRSENMTCDDCCYYTYDEDYDEYVCSMDMDEDDYARLMQSPQKHCPFWRNGDEYAVVRHQM